MKILDATRLLEEVGYKFIRQGKGSHVIYEKEGKRMVLSKGFQEMSCGMTAKVRSAYNKEKRKHNK